MPPDFSKTPRIDRAAGPLFGGAQAGRKEPAKKVSRTGNARAFARIRRADECMAGNLFPAAEGDQLHLILDSQRLNPGDILVALCRKIGCEVTRLRISTLTLSAERNLLQLLDLVDSKTVKTLSLLVSEFFMAHSPEMWNKIGAAFRERSCLLAASRTHCKICCLDCSDNRAYTLYGSGNLRTAKSHEQLTLVRDREVHDFYAGWIDEQIKLHAHTAQTEEAEAESQTTK